MPSPAGRFRRPAVRSGRASIGRSRRDGIVGKGGHPARAGRDFCRAARTAAGRRRNRVRKGFARQERAAKGSVPITGKSAPEGSHGMIFAEFFPKRLEIEEARDSLKPGDLITHLDDVPTPSAEDFVKVQERRAQPDALTGEWAKLTVEREG